MTLSDLIVETLTAHRDRTAVTDRSVELTYGSLVEASSTFAERLGEWVDGQRGGWPDHHDRLRIGLYAANSTEYVVAYLGILRQRWVPFLIDPSMGVAEIDHIVESCSLDAVVHDRALPGRSPVSTAGVIAGMTVSAVCYEPTERHELLDATEVCRFTSGSTGFANCIEFSGAAVYGAATSWADGTGLAPSDRILCFAGLSNGLAFNTSLLPAFLSGASLHLATGLPSAGHVVRLLSRTRATRLTGFPALYDSMARRGMEAEEAEDMARLRIAVSSGAPLRAETAAALRESAGLTVSNYYGVAETGPLTFDPEPGSGPGLGIALPGVSFRTEGTRDRPGPIRVRSMSMGSRYLNAPSVFESRLDDEGHYCTGDNGYLVDGHLVLAGRSGRTLNIGGRKVDPIEVRDLLRDLPGVADAVVLGDSKDNEDDMVVAVVAGGNGLHAEDLRTACLARLAAFKAPEQIFVVDALPGNSIGKTPVEAVRAIVRNLRARREAVT